jgi:phosphoribosylformylglycinamidine (FGAM) synthase-like enzyme
MSVCDNCQHLKNNLCTKYNKLPVANLTFCRKHKPIDVETKIYSTANKEHCIFYSYLP